MKKRVPTVYKYNQYKKKVLGTFIDADGYYWYQCVDLIRNYCREVYNYNMWRLPKAKDANLITTFPWWKWIEITDGINCKPWDIGITWGTIYWHIFIIDKVYNEGYDILEQNWSWKKSWAKIPWNEIRIRKCKWGTFIKWFRYVW